MELCQLLARVEAELFGEPAAGSLVGVERVGLAASTMQGEHQLDGHALLERMVGGKALELRHKLR